MCRTEDSDLDTTVAFEPPLEAADPGATVSLQPLADGTAPDAGGAGEAASGFPEPGGAGEAASGFPEAGEAPLDSRSADEGDRGSRSRADQAPESDGSAEPPPAA